MDEAVLIVMRAARKLSETRCNWKRKAIRDGLEESLWEKFGQTNGFKRREVGAGVAGQEKVTGVGIVLGLVGALA